MPAGPSDIGIFSAGEASLLQNIEYEKATSEVVRKNSIGGFGKANSFDPIITGSLTILGTSDTPLGLAAAGIDNIETGVTVFTEKTHTQVQDNYDETQTSFENAPSAEVGEAT